MPKPSEISDTPEATGFVKALMNEKIVVDFLINEGWVKQIGNLAIVDILREEIVKLLNAKDQEKEEAEKRIEEYLRQLVHTLHKEFCFTGLATEEQWNEGVSPKLKALANVIRGYSPDSPTARVYKFPALENHLISVEELGK